MAFATPIADSRFPAASLAYRTGASVRCLRRPDFPCRRPIRQRWARGARGYLNKRYLTIRSDVAAIGIGSMAQFV
jgi:hypothetical protein